jgi:hypothetical protein
VKNGLSIAVTTPESTGRIGGCCEAGAEGPATGAVTGATAGGCDCEAQPAVARTPTTAAQADIHCLIMVVTISRARRIRLGR